MIALLAKILHAVETSERFDEASADLDRLLEIAPGRSDVWEIRARIGLLLRDGSKETLAAWDRVTKDDSPAALRYGRAAARLWKAVTDGDAAAVDRAIEELGQVGRQPVTHAVAKLIAAVRMPDRYAAYVPEIAKDLQSDLARSLYALAVVAWLDREENPDALKRLGSTDAGSDPDVARRCAEWAVKLGERGPDAKRWFRKAASFYEEAARTDPPRKGEMQKRAAEMLQRAGK